jgi:hypothetical protein
MSPLVAGTMPAKSGMEALRLSPSHGPSTANERSRLPLRSRRTTRQTRFNPPICYYNDTPANSHELVNIPM